MKYRIFSIAILLVAFVAVTASAGNIVVIVNPASSINEATAAEVSKLFMGKSTSIADNKFSAIDQSTESDVRADFSDKILGRTVKKVDDYWKKRVFAGKGEPPESVANDAKVIAHVAATPDAIGYIGASSLNDKVKAIMVDGKVEW